MIILLVATFILRGKVKGYRSKIGLEDIMIVNQISNKHSVLKREDNETIRLYKTLLCPNSSP